MTRKKRTRRKKPESKSMTLNAAIGIVGVLLLGFIYSFSRDVSHTGIPIEVTFPQHEEEIILAVDVYKENPIHNIKVEVLNGCGKKRIAAMTADFLRRNQIDVVRADDADHHNYPTTTIIQRNEKAESLKRVSESFGIQWDNEIHVKIVPDESLGVDVTVVIGKDFENFSTLSDFISNSY
ncbi:MAG: LytR C-terminal domain-containing protein [Candidatus Neomarinimicrobiota bacterium]|nr:LytR C-terminal domain-containing protein [Candidatus Neomarinimicrobiota bacterium]